MSETIQTVVISGAALLLGLAAIFGVVQLLKLVNTKANQGKAEWDFVRDVIASLVLAAQQLAKNGVIPNVGPEKRKWVLDQAEVILKKYKIDIELDAVAAILEAVYIQYIGSVVSDLIEDEQNDGDGTADLP